MDLSGNKWIEGSGKYEVKQADADDPGGIIKKGDFYFENLVAGTVAFPSDQAYGEWEFDLYKDISSSVVNIIIVGDDRTPTIPTNGYYLNVSNTEGLRFRTLTNGSAGTILQSSDAYIEFETWYRIKITRTLDGEFYLYIRGGVFGNNSWTLVDSSIGGTNPVTNNTFMESIYMSLDFDTGDRIANIIIRKSVQQ